MHDLVSSRKEQFARLGSSDSLPQISEQEELRLLTGADVVVAIQEEEAAYVRERTGGHEVVCAPIAIEAAQKPHPGEKGSLLFVGTKTAPM
jgi:succinoglycan biosynthesis protein ExoO